MRHSLSVILLSITLPVVILAWPVLLITVFVPFFGFLALPTILSSTLFILYGSTWLTYLVLIPVSKTGRGSSGIAQLKLPYSPRRCYKICRVLWRYLRDFYRLNIGNLIINWCYKKLLILGNTGRSKGRKGSTASNGTVPTPVKVVAENIEYGSRSGNKKLDVYYAIQKKTAFSTPDGGIEFPGDAKADELEPTAPVVIFIPGGGWMFASKRFYLQLGLSLRRKGLVVVIPDITLYPEGTVKDMVIDIRKVLEWTNINIHGYGGDNSSIYLMGHGSGGHLALLTIVQEAVVKSRDLHWLSAYSKDNDKSVSQDGDAQDSWAGHDLDNDQEDDGHIEDDLFAIESAGAGRNASNLRQSTASSRSHRTNHSAGELEISAGIRRLEIWGENSGRNMPKVKGLILLAGISDVIKHIRYEFRQSIEELSQTRSALGVSHANCLMASPSHLLFGAKQIIDTRFLPDNILLIHGGADRDIPIVQSVLLKTLFQNIGVNNVAFRAYRDLTHLECVTAIMQASLGKGAPKRKSRYTNMIMGEIVALINEDNGIISK